MKIDFFKVTSSNIFSLLLIVCLGLVVYSNSFHATFQFDDKPSIVDNYAIKHLGDVQTIWDSWPCRFLTYLSFAINYHFCKLDVLGYHLFNIVVHIISALLVWWFVLLTFSTPAMKDNKISAQAPWIALVAGLIFVSHPIQTEAVTYIVQRASSMAGLFYLASICLYVKSRLLQETKSQQPQAGKYYILALIMTVMTMFTKEMAITLPLMILLYELSFFKSSKQALNWKNLTPFLVTIVIIPLTMVLTKYIDFHGMRRTIEGPQGISSMQYLLTQFRVLVTYLRLDFFPINQNIDYEYTVSKSLFELSTLGSLLLLIGVLYFAVRLFKNYRLLSFSIFWFFLTLLPESSVIPIRDAIFEHRLYLPLVGYSIFLAAGIFYILRNKSLLTIGIVFAVIIIVNSILTYERNKVWQDEFHLWDDTVKKSPHKERPVNILGTIYELKGDFKQAIADYNKSIELNPRFAAAYSNRGNVYNKQGNLTQAILDYSKALEMVPNSAETYNNRGNAYENQGNLAKAILDYDKAIGINPILIDAYSNRAACYMKQGKVIEALSDYNKAIALSPDYLQAYNNRANLYDTIGHFDQAVLDYDQAIKLSPHLALLYKNRGASYFKQGKFVDALSDFNKSIQLDGKYVEGYYNRAVTNYQLKKYDESWADLHKLEALGGSFAALRQVLQKSTGRNQ